MSAPDISDLDPVETVEWQDALKAVQQHRGAERANHLLNTVVDQARRDGVYVPRSLTTAYRNTIAPEAEEKSPGDRAIEHRLRSIIRWNAMAIILRANKESLRARRPHRQLPVGGHAVRHRLRPLLARADRDTTAATCCSSRATARPASMRAPSSKGG